MHSVRFSALQRRPFRTSPPHAWNASERKAHKPSASACVRFSPISSAAPQLFAGASWADPNQQRIATAIESTGDESPLLMWLKPTNGHRLRMDASGGQEACKM